MRFTEYLVPLFFKPYLCFDHIAGVMFFMKVLAMSVRKTESQNT